jgi:hypothetical protein
MTDFQLEGVGVQVDTQSLVKPPVVFMVLTAAVVVISAACAVFNSGVGYLIAVGASIMGGVTSLQDQKRQAHPSYVTLAWFRPTLRVLRYLVLAVTLLHVTRLAIAAAKGSGVLF